MTKFGSFKLFLSAAILTTSLSATAQDEGLSFSSQKISGSVYMLSGEGGFTGGNIALSIGDDGVAMIDNGMPSVLDILRSKVAELTDKPIDYLINTHVHGDHTGNNTEYGRSGARIISHENLRANMLDKGIAGEKAPADALPIFTFSDQITLHINGDAARIVHVKNAHTDGDAIIHFQTANVIHTGDVLFNGLFPFIDNSNGGTLGGAIDALKSIAAMADDNTKIIPGHGPLASKADVNSTVAMLEDARSIVAKMVADGKSDDEIIAADPLASYQSYSWAFIDSEKMIKQIIANIR